MSGFDHLKVTYFDECAELLEAAYSHLAAIEEGRADDDTVNAIFRSFHSIKGGGGAFGFDRLVAFAHELEAGPGPAAGRPHGNGAANRDLAGSQHRRTQ